MKGIAQAATNQIPGLNDGKPTFRASGHTECMEYINQANALRTDQFLPQAIADMDEVRDCTDKLDTYEGDVKALASAFQLVKKATAAAAQAEER